MANIVYAVMILCLLLAIVKCLIDINVIDKRINEILAEEKRQNKRIEKKYDHYRSYAIQGDCFKYVCSCNDCGQPLWGIEDYNYFKGERGYKPPYCPNCGRRLEE